MNICMTPTLKWWKINMNLEGNHKNGTLKLPSFFHQVCFIVRFLYVIHKKWKKSQVTILRKYHRWLNFYPIIRSIYNSSVNYLH